MHPEHLWVAGGVRAKGALVAGEALLVQAEGGYTPAALRSNAQINRGHAWIEWGGASRTVSRRGRRAVQPLEKGFLQLGITTGGASVCAGAGAGAGNGTVSILGGGRVLDTYMSQIGLQLCGDKVAKAADVGFVICGEKKRQYKGQSLPRNHVDDTLLYYQL